MKVAVSYDHGAIFAHVGDTKEFKVYEIQDGKVIAGTSLHATTQQIDNTTGTIYAQDQLNLNVTNHLNNQSGTLAAKQQVQIQAKNLNNNVGKMLVALGQATWMPGQLEYEIQNNFWLTLPINYDIIFETPSELRYDAALEQFGFNSYQLVGNAARA